MEISFLEKRKSNIPKQNSDIRDQIASELNIELPFVGELLRVNDKAWEGAIERVLRPFALSLLVDKVNYTKVSRYIDKTNLKGRIVYLRVMKSKNTSLSPLVENSVVEKIDILHDTPFYEWLEEELYRRFDYSCVESMTEFRRFKRALTKNGQIKSSLVRHEKDDRFRVDDKRRYILGWENKEKLVALKSDMKRIESELAPLLKELKTIMSQLQELDHSRDTLRDLLHFEDFEQIDWYSIAKKIEELKRQKEELESSSDIIKTLEESLKKVEAQHREKYQELNQLHQKQGKIASDIEKFKSEKEESLELYVSKKESLEKYSLDLKYQFII